MMLAPSGMAEMKSWKQRYEELQYDLKNWGIVEISLRNNNVFSYMQHWEKRVSDAEQMVEFVHQELANRRNELDGVDRETRLSLAMIPNAVHIRDTNGDENVHVSLAVSIRGLLEENNILRGLVAKGQGDCVYCSLPASDIAKCTSGFPGCARMDDIVNAPETDKDRDILDLRMRLLSARLEVEAVLDAIPNAVRVREGGGDEDVFASLAVSVAKMVNGGKK